MQEVTARAGAVALGPVDVEASVLMVFEMAMSPGQCGGLIFEHAKYPLTGTFCRYTTMFIFPLISAFALSLTLCFVNCTKGGSGIVKRS